MYLWNIEQIQYSESCQHLGDHYLRSNTSYETMYPVTYAYIYLTAMIKQMKLIYTNCMETQKNPG